MCAASWVALALSAVGRPAAAQPSPHDAGIPHDAGRTTADLARRATVLAHVNADTITVGDFEDILNEAPTPIRATYTDPARRRETLDNLIQTMLLADEARRRGLDRDPQVSSAIRRILGQRVEQVEVLQAITPESIPASEVEAFYNAHVADYQQPEYRRATVVITNDQGTAVQALTELREAHGDMRRTREIVRNLSVDERSRAHEGDTFYFQRNGTPSGDPHPVRSPDGGITTSVDLHPVDAALAEAMFTLPREMEATPTVISIAGGRYAVGVLTGIRPVMNRPPTDPGVVASIRGFLVRERRQQREQQLLTDVRTRLHPEIHEDLLSQIHLPPSDLGNLPGFSH